MKRPIVSANPAGIVKPSIRKRLTSGVGGLRAAVRLRR
jgi:hypothetical protein